jgi:polynucleotide 5'-kinase involved in rRNA processing
MAARVDRVALLHAGPTASHLCSSQRRITHAVQVEREAPMSVAYSIESDAVRTLSKLIEESTRSTSESVKYFVEPSPGVLHKAKNKRNHIIFGRRGSGKSSLLHKVAADLTVGRTPIAYVDLEQFKGHSYPDVLISVLVSSFTEFKRCRRECWLELAA